MCLRNGNYGPEAIRQILLGEGIDLSCDRIRKLVIQHWGALSSAAHLIHETEKARQDRALRNSRSPTQRAGNPKAGA